MLVNFDKLKDVFFTISLTRNDYIEGIIPLRDSDGNVIFEYKISIDFNFVIPKVKELEGLIHHDIDRHLYPSDRSLCLGYPLPLLSFLINNGYDCYSYVENKVLPYLANQYYFDRNGEWFIKGLDHDIGGKIDFYSKIFKTDRIIIILSRLGDVLNNKKYGRNASCFCGSELKYKNCHQKREITPNERNILQKDYEELSKHLNPET